jgi:hypothetical protein
MDLEIPLGKRTALYRFFEVVPALLTYGAILLLIVLSVISPTLGASYLLVIIITMLVKAIGMAYRIIGGCNTLSRAEKVNWSQRLMQLEDPKSSYALMRAKNSNDFNFSRHLENLRLISASEDEAFPKPSQLYNAIIIAIYNENLDVLIPTIESILATSYPNDRIIVTLAYEERGGVETEQKVSLLKDKYKNSFSDFITVKHPDGIKGEVIGKGSNITNAGHFLKKYFEDRKIAFSNVIITTLDSDNRPHKSYFDYVTYEYICHEDRKRLSYQPISLFTNNIWDAPAPMRVIATGNSFWNIVCSMRPHSLRNFASHSQSLDALVELNFWSTRTIVEDGHQFWRSYFFFKGDYTVLPIHVPIYQDAVMSYSFIKTLKAQFIQLRRWGYGASDVPYVATRIFTKKRQVPLGDGIAKLWRLVDSHVTLGCMSLLVAFGGWIPLITNSSASRSVVAHQLPIIVSRVQMVALIGLFITILLSIKMLPKRPSRYKKQKTIVMILQWVLMPLTAILYNSAASIYSQTRLAAGKYMDKFDVTDKATYASHPRRRIARSSTRERQ